MRNDLATGAGCCARPTMHTSSPSPAEEWRPVPGHDGYEVSSLGRVRSTDRIVSISGRNGDYPRLIAGKILKPWKAGSRREYEYISLGATFKCAVHRLVAAAFHGAACSGDFEVAHFDGDPRCNRANNLRWATRTENEQDKRRHGTYFTRVGMQGERHHKAKLTDGDVVAIRQRMTGARGELTAVATEYGVDRSTIARIRDGQGWRHVA